MICQIKKNGIMYTKQAKQLLKRFHLNIEILYNFLRNKNIYVFYNSRSVMGSTFATIATRLLLPTELTSC